MVNENSFFDKAETRSQDERTSAMFKALPIQISNAKDNSPYFAKILKSFDPEQIVNHSIFTSLPVTRKSDLIDLQKAHPPLGGLTTCEPGKLKRIFQ